MLATVQLPDGASLPRTQGVLDDVAARAAKTPGVDKVLTIAGISALDNNASLANAGVAYIILKDWDVRGKKQGLLPMLTSLNAGDGADRGRDRARVAAAADPGHRLRRRLHHAARAARQLARLQQARRRHQHRRLERRDPVDASALVLSSFRADTPQYAVDIDRVKAQALGVTVDQVFSALGGYLGSAYVNQFTKFGRVFQVFVQADADFRLNARGRAQSHGAQFRRQHDSARHADQDHADDRAVADQPLQSLSVGDGDRHAGSAASRPARRWR